MTKKIILLALAVASLAAFAMPAAATAAEEDLQLHITPVPEGSQKVDGVGVAKLFGPLGTIVECESHTGTLTFTSSTTGTFQQEFHGCHTQATPEKPCTTTGQPAGTIKTEVLVFHLVTAVDSVNGSTGNGLLVTPTNEKFASFTCKEELPSVVGGNGIVGTITKPGCSEVTTKEATISFTRSAGTTQTHKTVAATETPSNVKKHTPTEYSLTAFGAAAAEEAHATVTFNKEAHLECT